MSNENIKNKDEIQKKIDYLIEQQKYIKKESSRSNTWKTYKWESNDNVVLWNL